MQVFAESLGQIGGAGLGPFSNLGSSGAAANAFTKTISGIIGVITLGAAIWFMIQLFIGGLNWLSSGGEKTKLNEARDRITNAFVGLIIVVAGWGIIALTGQFLGGFEILLPSSIIDKIKLF
ncbi:hypothetical protein HY086_00635 [Candidatus Gottesmanbacteria bacterium]|nr:hypothetical protein [Candidatus Gottesmanbacteria bacterium]